MKIRNLFAALLAILCLTSCASQRAVTQPAVNQIRPGVTTEADLRQFFGPPDTKLTSFQGWTSLAWFRSLGPKPGGYVPVFGEALGGLDLEVQQLSVVLGNNLRVRSYTVYDSNGRLKTKSRRTETVREVDFRK